MKQDISNKQLIKARTEIFDFNSTGKVVELNEDVLEKAIQDMSLQVYSPDQLNNFKTDLKKAFDAKLIEADELKKAKKDLSKLVKVTKVDKNGKKSTVWVKQSEVRLIRGLDGKKVAVTTKPIETKKEEKYDSTDEEKDDIIFFINDEDVTSKNIDDYNEEKYWEHFSDAESAYNFAYQYVNKKKNN
jgi:hypothetical protein